MFPDTFDITSVDDLTALNGQLLTALTFLGDQDLNNAFTINPEAITVGDYLALIDAAEASLITTDFSFLAFSIPTIRAQLEAILTPDNVPDGLSVQQVIDQSIGVLEDIAAGDFGLLTVGFDAIRAALEGVPSETLLLDAFGFTGPGNPDIIDAFLDLLPQFSTDAFPAWVSGDPHLKTLDGVDYDFQAAGEFVLLQSTDAQGFALQARMVPVAANVSVNQAIATNLDGTAVMIDAADPDPLHVNGAVVALADGSSLDVGEGRIYRRGDVYTIVYPGADGAIGNGDSQVVVRVREGRLDLDVRLNAELLGSLEGLLGDGDGNPDNDIARADGTVLARPLVFSELYGAYRDDWRISSLGDSLFSYEFGESPNGFYQSDFPGAIVSLDTLDPEVLATAREAALAAGLQEGSEAFENAVLDFALTNDESFLTSALDVPLASVGTELADTLIGNSGDDVLRGEGGDDGVFGQSGNDILDGGAGNDSIAGADGNDLISGGLGNDNIGGGLGNDTIDGGEGDDIIGAGFGDDSVTGGAGNDVVAGGAGDDTLEGGDGNDSMSGSFGNDLIDGGGGADDIGGGTGRDTIDAGAGNDSVGGGEGDDSILGGEGNDFLAGGGRNDTIDGGAGNDTINAGAGNDVITGGTGADQFVFSAFFDGEADVITDFEDGLDSFFIRRFDPDTGVENINNGGNGLAGFVTAMNIVDVTGGAQMTVNGNTILVEGVTAAQLTVDDFTFL
ncbi:VWD domain-containing protein [Roseovarius mucosus]|uniref:VWD domain-containing protein n=1 Tax=Roseovarius mucosus TaxID=215743 RepID=UPI0035CF032E